MRDAVIQVGFKRLCPIRLERPEARIRLFCFAFAGGSADAFRPWMSLLPALLPSEVEVCAVELPGRGRRISEPLARELRPLVQQLLVELEPLLDKPLAFFGHSLGAKVAFELARHCVEQGRRVEHLYVSADLPPHLRPARPPIREMSDPQFIAYLSKLEGTPRGVLDNPELMDLFLPILRADFELYDSYETSREQPLAVPITALAGTQDGIACPEKVDEWQHYTNRDFRLVRVDGGHFFMHSHQERVLQVIAGSLARQAA